MGLPYYITTREAMKLCRVNTYDKLNSILAEREITRVWASGEGNIYRRDDFLSQNDSSYEGGFANV